MAGLNDQVVLPPVHAGWAVRRKSNHFAAYDQVANDFAKEIGIENYAYCDNPAVFWDLYGEKGHPIRTTISEMGPLLLSRLLGLNETQEGVLSIAWVIGQAALEADRKSTRLNSSH